MFFFLSKTLGIMLLPANFLIGVGLLGAILLVTRFAPLGRKLLVVSIVLLAICGIFAARKSGALSPGTAVSAMGCGARRAGRHRRARADRSTLIFRPHRTRPCVHGAADRIDRSCGACASISERAHHFFRGKRESDIRRCQGSRLRRRRLRKSRRCQRAIDRWSGARATPRKTPNSPRRSPHPKSGERWLLVTSAYHMPRSVGLFRKAGFAVEPYPVDWRAGKRADILTFSPDRR